MNAFSCLNGSVNGSNKFTDIKNQHCNDITNVFAAYGFWAEHDGDCPPESKAVDEKQ